MALSITTNVQSLNSQRGLLRATNNLGETFKRLSSGLRINAAKDDSAGLSISTRMTAQVRGTNQAVRNANDAVSLLQVAEGALDETTNALQRMRELAVQSANDTYVGGDRDDMQLEVNELINEIQRIADNTEYNDQVLLSGGYAGGSTGIKMFHVGADADQTIQVTIGSAHTTALGVNALSVGADAGQSGANTAITTVDAALDSVSDIRATLGSFQNRFESVIANLSSVSENTVSARSRIMDADIAAESANLTKNAILQQAGTAMLAQANQQPQIALQLLG